MEDGVQSLTVDYLPRPQFTDFHDRKQRFACIVAHRRAGKTVACVHDLQKAALSCALERPRFAYIAPYLKQAKAVVWDYLCAAATPFLPYGATINESELRVDYPNGGQVRLYGADNINALRGIYLDGVVLDEHADMDDRLWPEVIRPTLTDRKGWGVFIGTPKGRNEFYNIHKRASEDSKNWFSLVLKASETGLIDKEELLLNRGDMSEEQYLQEYECSFDARLVGTYYAKLMADADNDKRICGVPYDPQSRVWTSWDLGRRDATAIWFAQRCGREIHIIDYHEAASVTLDHHVKVIEAKPYLYGGHILPHDVQVKEMISDKSRLEHLQSIGLKDITMAPKLGVMDGIDAVRTFIPRCWFDAQKCKRGIEALRLYRSEWDEEKKIFRAQPRHDWTSHPADSFRYLATTFDRTASRRSRKLDYVPLGFY